VAEHIGENVRRVLAKLRILKNLKLVDSPEKGKIHHHSGRFK